MSLKLITAPATEPLTISEVMAHARIDASNAEPAPGVITAALAATPIAGNVDDGAHRYLATFITADGETEAGTISAAVTVADKAVNGKVELTAIPLGGALVTSRKLYRTVADGSTYLLLSTLADNTTAIYTDNIADASLGAGAPSTNTTSDPLLTMLISAARQHAEQELHRHLITQTWELALDAFPAVEIQIPIASSVSSVKYLDSAEVEQTVDASDYSLDDYGMARWVIPVTGFSWPATYDAANAVKVRFVAGYGSAADVPACVRNWMLIRIKSLYDGRDQIQTASGTAVIGPHFADSLLDSERVMGRV